MIRHVGHPTVQDSFLHVSIAALALPPFYDKIALLYAVYCYCRIRICGGRIEPVF